MSPSRLPARENHALFRLSCKRCLAVTRPARADIVIEQAHRDGWRWLDGLGDVCPDCVRFEDAGRLSAAECSLELVPPTIEQQIADLEMQIGWVESCPPSPSREEVLLRLTELRAELVRIKQSREQLALDLP